MSDIFFRFQGMPAKRTLRVDLNELRDYMRLVAEGKPREEIRG